MSAEYLLLLGSTHLLGFEAAVVDGQNITTQKKRPRDEPN